jgi:hypothetical protein
MLPANEDQNWIFRQAILIGVIITGRIEPDNPQGEEILH